VAKSIPKSITIKGYAWVQELNFIKSPSRHSSDNILVVLAVHKMELTQKTSRFTNQKECYMSRSSNVIELSNDLSGNSRLSFDVWIRQNVRYIVSL